MITHNLLTEHHDDSSSDNDLLSDLNHLSLSIRRAAIRIRDLSARHTYAGDRQKLHDTYAELMRFDRELTQRIWSLSSLDGLDSNGDK